MKYYQQLHSEDDGVIIIVADRQKNWMLCCRECKSSWKLENPFPFPIEELTKEFKSYQKPRT